MPAVTAPIELKTLEDAFAAREFFLVYQPIVTLQRGECVGAEALIRWRRGETVLNAGDFMPVADGSLLSGSLTYWVVDTVASELGDFLATHPEAQIGINIPPEILGRGGLEYAAEKSGLRALAKQLILEVTERGIPDQLGIDALNRIPETGARVALDDTSLSPANLALLLRCQFDLVKIAGTLVAQLGAGLPRPGWLGGLAALLGTTKLVVIAEGVENDYQAGVLRAAGVQLAQGHLFSAALSAKQFFRYYAAHRAH
jgi:sensor c-di-GMP phosphodiesterase-like protein